MFVPGRQSRAQLEILLEALFDGAELRRWLKALPDGETITALLPEANSSRRELVGTATDLLLRHGYIDVAFFEALCREFPRRRVDIAAVLRTWLSTRATSAPTSPPSFEELVDGSAAQRLEAAYQQREQLLSTGQDITAVDKQIRGLRRGLRQGPHLNAGDQLGHGRYRLIAVLGTGGFSTVWQAYDRELRAGVALKVLHGQWTGDRSVRERLTRGIRNMIMMRHPNIVSALYGVRDDGGYVFAVMELVAGGTLQARISRRNLVVQEAIHIAVQICDALEYAHGRGIVHRDVKPANILLAESGAAKLGDFDLMKGDDTTGGTRTGAGIGTFLFAAPELMNDAANATPQADVYGLGMTLLACLVPREFDITVLTNPEAWIGKADCSARVQAVLRQAIAHEPAKRFHSAAALRHALTTALTDENPVVRSSADPLFSRVREQFRRRIHTYRDDDTWGPESYSVAPDRTVVVRRGELILQHAGALVCGIDSRGEYRGETSKRMQEFSGTVVSETVAELEGLIPGTVIAAGGGRTAARYVFHVVLKSLEGSVLGSVRKQLHTALTKCGELAEELKVESLAVPLLCAEMGAPVTTVLNTLFLEATQIISAASFLRLVEIIVPDGGAALERAGGHVRVQLWRMTRQPDQCFLLRAVPVGGALIEAVWSAISMPLRPARNAYGKEWAIVGAKERVVLDAAEPLGGERWPSGSIFLLVSIGGRLAP